MVLKLKVQERVRINGNIWVTVTNTHGRFARLGIDAPRGVEIVREKLLPETDKYPAILPAKPAYYSTPTDAGA